MPRQPFTPRRRLFSHDSFTWPLIGQRSAPKESFQVEKSSWLRRRRCRHRGRRRGRRAGPRAFVRQRERKRKKSLKEAFKRPSLPSTFSPPLLSSSTINSSRRKDADSTNTTHSRPTTTTSPICGTIAQSANSDARVSLLLLVLSSTPQPPGRALPCSCRPSSRAAASTAKAKNTTAAAASAAASS